MGAKQAADGAKNERKTWYASAGKRRSDEQRVNEAHVVVGVLIVSVDHTGWSMLWRGWWMIWL